MKLEHRTGDPRGLKLLEENARYMRYETFQKLVAQVKEDGALQQWPFVYADPVSGEKIVLSGNHRVQAAIEAGLEIIDWIECDEPLSRDEQIRIQLAHNSLVGEDDPELLRHLYESIEDLDERLATGLDDASLEMLMQSSTLPLSEVNLDYTTLTIVFLPEEFERAQAAFEEARKLGGGTVHYHLARFEQHERTLAAIEDARAAAHVANTATALDILLDVWDAHREDLQSSWLTEGGELQRSGKQVVPISSITGPNVMAEHGQIIARAVKKHMARHPEMKTPGEALADLLQMEQ